MRINVMRMTFVRNPGKNNGDDAIQRFYIFSYQTNIIKYKINHRECFRHKMF